MDKNKLIVHRANYIEAERDPLRHLKQLIKEGYRNLEIDLTMTGAESFKFCHPSQLDIATEYSFDSAILDQVAKLHDNLLWLVDIKYQVLGDTSPPNRLLDMALEAFGTRVIFVAARPELLTAAHKLRAPTAQFFRDDIVSRLSFAPDYLIYGAPIGAGRKLSNLIVFCRSLDEAKDYIVKGAKYVMMDGAVLIND